MLSAKWTLLAGLVFLASASSVLAAPKPEMVGKKQDA